MLRSMAKTGRRLQTPLKERDFPSLTRRGSTWQRICRQPTMADGLKLKTGAWQNLSTCSDLTISSSLLTIFVIATRRSAATAGMIISLQTSTGGHGQSLRISNCINWLSKLARSGLTSPLTFLVAPRRRSWTEQGPRPTKLVLKYTHLKSQYRLANLLSRNKNSPKISRLRGLRLRKLVPLRPMLKLAPNIARMCRVKKAPIPVKKNKWAARTASANATTSH